MKTQYTFPKLIEQISNIDLGSIAASIIGTTTTPIAPSPVEPEPEPDSTPEKQSTRKDGAGEEELGEDTEILIIPEQETEEEA
jgi:hypothetical protein